MGLPVTRPASANAQESTHRETSSLNSATPTTSSAQVPSQSDEPPASDPNEITAESFSRIRAQICRSMEALEQTMERVKKELNELTHEGDEESFPPLTRLFVLGTMISAQHQALETVKNRFWEDYQEAVQPPQERTDAIRARINETLRGVESNERQDVIQRRINELADRLDEIGPSTADEGPECELTEELHELMELQKNNTGGEDKVEEAEAVESEDENEDDGDEHNEPCENE